MGFILRFVFIFANLILISQIILNPERLFSIIILLGVLSFQIVELIRRELRLFQSFEEFLKTVEFEDRSIKFNSKLPKGMKAFAEMFNKLLEVIEKKRSENEAQLIFLEALLKNVKVGVFTISDQHKIERSNSTALSLLNVNNLHHLDQIKLLNNKFYHIIQSAQNESSTILESDEWSLSIQINTIKIQDRNIKIVSFQDIKSQIELKEMEAWHQLIRTLGHEILNSVTPISSMTETGLMLLQDDKNNTKSADQITQNHLDKIKDAFTTVNRRSNSLLGFIENYRKLTRMPKPILESQNLCELVDEISALLSKELESSKIILKKTYLSSSIKAMIDKSMIEQVLLNLIKNASEAVKENIDKELTLKVGVTEDLHPFILIKDNGTGISKESLEKIFIPFYTTKEEGTGIGLSLSRQIIQLHAGKLLVHSEEGMGSEFKLIFKSGGDAR